MADPVILSYGPRHQSRSEAVTEPPKARIALMAVAFSFLGLFLLLPLVLVFVKALEEDPQLAAIDDWVDDSGEGRWTVDEAIDNAVPLPVISAALFARFASRQEQSPALKAVAALRQQFGGHAVKAAGPASPEKPPMKGFAVPAIVVIVPLPDPPNAPVAPTTDATAATPTASRSLARPCLRARVGRGPAR